MTDRHQDIATALAEAARTINAPRSIENTLDAITAGARVSVPGFDQVGISVMHKDGKIETKAGTGELVWALDSLQYELDEGPCVTSMRDPQVVVVENARHEQRWPRYIPEALKAGLRSQLAVYLYDNGETIGGLNLYSTTSDTIHADASHAADLFATHAALALGHARREEQLHEALDTRKTVGQAIGLLMEHHQINEERAFQLLLRASSTSNIKLRDVAREVVNAANEKYRAKLQ